MNQLVTTGAVIARTNYGEADRIITLLTPDQGKVRLMARGARRAKSKLAGGIELFSVSDITFARGRSEIGTLVSSRLRAHYGNIVQDVDRVMQAHEMIRMLDRSTEDTCGPEYFELLQGLLVGLHDLSVPLPLVRAWFAAQLLKSHGITPNLQEGTNGVKLQSNQHYVFGFEAMAFTQDPEGHITAKHIKFLRLLFGDHQPATLMRIEGVIDLATAVLPLIDAIRQQYIQV